MLEPRLGARPLAATDRHAGILRSGCNHTNMIDQTIQIDSCTYNSRTNDLNHINDRTCVLFWLSLTWSDAVGVVISRKSPSKN